MENKYTQSKKQWPDICAWRLLDIIRNLSVLGSPADWSQRGLVLRHSFVRRLMFNRVVFGPKCPYLVMISKAPFDTKIRNCKEWVPCFCPFASPPAKDHLFQCKIFMKSQKIKSKETLGPMPPGLMQMPDLYRWKGTSLFNASLLPHLIFYEFIHLLSLLCWWCCEWKVWGRWCCPQVESSRAQIPTDPIPLLRASRTFHPQHSVLYAFPSKFHKREMFHWEYLDLCLSEGSLSWAKGWVEPDWNTEKMRRISSFPLFSSFCCVISWFWWSAVETRTYWDG